MINSVYLNNCRKLSNLYNGASKTQTQNMNTYLQQASKEKLSKYLTILVNRLLNENGSF